jgi:iron complex transport system substrate-binding protein
LIIGMQATDHLVAVSNWDADRTEIRSLPRVGDYRSIDWEKLAQLRPSVMIVQFRADKMPSGLAERAADLKIQLLNVKNNRLADLYETLDLLGDALGERGKSDAAKSKIKRELESIQQQAAINPPVRTLLLRSSSDLASVGGGNFLDELLTIAGGKNVLEGGDNSYPTIDRERLLALDPEVIVYLLPGASAQVVGQAKSSLAGMKELKAVRNGRVVVLTEDYLLVPGFAVGKIARQLASQLHPEAFATSLDCGTGFQPVLKGSEHGLKTRATKVVRL